MPEASLGPDLRRPVLDPALARDRGAARPAAVAAPASAARLRQVAVQAVLAALRPVDVAVDRLVADRGPAVRLVPLEPAGDLLRRPAGLQALGDVRAQPIVHDQLATSLPAPPRQVLGVQGKVAAETAVAVAEAVAAQLAVDRGRVAAEPLGDLADRGAGLDQAEEGAALIEVELAVGPGQRRLRRANPCKGWGFALRDRTHRSAGWRAPGRTGRRRCRRPAPRGVRPRHRGATARQRPNRRAGERDARRASAAPFRTGTGGILRSATGGGDDPRHRARPLPPVGGRTYLLRVFL